MSSSSTEENRERLAHQSLGRPLTDLEAQLAAALEQIYAAKEKRPSEVVRLLQERAVRQPSGKTRAWTEAVLEEELALINASLDEAYEAGEGKKH